MTKYNDANFEEVYNLIDEAYKSNKILEVIDDDLLHDVLYQYINEGFYEITYSRFNEIFDRWLDNNF